MAQFKLGEHLDDPVTHHIRTDFVRIFVHQTIGEALAEAQRAKMAGRIVYFYVVDDDQRLTGVVPTRRLLLNPPETPIADIMVRNVIALPHSASLLEACEFFLFHRLLALPVVDDEKRIVGVIDVELYTEEMSDLARREESDDIFQIIGVRLAQIREASVPIAFQRRFPWLLCNIGGGLACAFLAGYYQEVLDAAIVLALFIPIVLALGESVSIQSLTLTLQAQHVQRIEWKSALNSLFREAPIGLLLGLSSGALVALVALLWHRQGMVALCILLSIVLSVTTAALFGLTIPTVLRSLQRDPKVASGPLVLALTDIATLFYYLALGTWLLL